MESTTYQTIPEQGIHQGMEKGMEKGCDALRQTCREIAILKLGELPEEAEARISGLVDLDALRTLASDLLAAADRDAALSILRRAGGPR